MYQHRKIKANTRNYEQIANKFIGIEFNEIIVYADMSF